MNGNKLTELQLDIVNDEIIVAHLNNKSRLLQRALYKTSNSEISHDLVQSTFLKTLTYLHKGGKINLMHSFLNHVLNDLIIDEYRKKKSISLDLLLENGFEPQFSNIERDINIIDGKGVIVLIPQLTRKYEQVIRLRYLQGLSLKEMALITGQSENTISVQLHRGMVKLRKLYEEQIPTHVL